MQDNCVTNYNLLYYQCVEDSINRQNTTYRLTESKIYELIFYNNSNDIAENTYELIPIYNYPQLELIDTIWRKSKYDGSYFNDGTIKINATEKSVEEYQCENNTRGMLDTTYWPERNNPHSWIQNYQIFGDSIVGILFNSSSEWQYYKRSYISGWEALDLALDQH
jgi:hypothetical protein